MKSLNAFLAVVLLMFCLIASPALAKSGKGRMGDVDRAMRADRIDRALDREFDATQINKRFTNELKDLKGNFDKGDIDKNEFDKKAAELKAGFLRDLEDADAGDGDR